MDYIKINKVSKIPIYEQIESSIELAITNNDLVHQYQLPTEKEISEFYNISIGSVKRALINLEDRDLIYRIKGKGSFVNNRPQHTFTLKQLKLEESCDCDFYSALVEKKKSEKYDYAVASQFNCPNLYHVIRIYNDDVFSLIVEESYLAEKAFRHIEYELIKETPMSDIIDHYSLTQLNKQVNTMYAEKADSKLAKIFSIKVNDPISCINSTYLNKNGDTIAVIIRKVPSEYTFIESETNHVPS